MRLLICTLSFLFCQFSYTQDYIRSFDSNKKPTDITSKATVLYSNDFSNAADWSFQNTSSNNGNWVITSDASAAPYPFFVPAGFPTAANNFAIIDSDLQGSGETQDCILSLDSVITACATTPFVVLRFNQMLRRFNDTTSVEVSNDGVTWTEFWCNTNLSNNENTGNPEKVDINISSVAGNEDSVYIRFRYRAEYAWFWAIDEVEILAQDQFDLEGMETGFGSVGNWGKRLPYYQIPLEQIAPISFTGHIKNAGYQTQFDIIATSSDGLGYTSSSLPEALGGNQSGTFDIQNTWTPASTFGIKTVNTVASSSELDGDITNDDLETVSVEINPKYYSRSTDIRTGRVSNNFSQYGFEAGNVFDIFGDATLTSAMAHVADETTPGSILFAKLYEAIDSVTFNLISASDTITIPSLTTDEVFRLRFNEPQNLIAGKSYLLTAGSIGSPTFPGLVMGTSNKAEIFTSYYQGENSVDWFSYLETPMVKMNFESVADITDTENNKYKVHISPNPSSGNFVLSVEGNNGEKLNIKVVSASGREVKKFVVQTDEVKIPLDFEDLRDGTYFVHVVGESITFIDKVIILK